MEEGRERARRLPWDGCLNVRDVGGYPTVDGARTRWGALLRADNLCQLTPAGCAALLNYGVRTIIDLHPRSEHEAPPHPFGPGGAHAGAVHYHNLLLRDPGDASLARALRETRTHLETYRLSVDRFAPGIAAVIRAVAVAPDGGVLVHCNVGKDRTGVVIALLLALAGVPDVTIAEDYALSEGYLRPLYWARARASGVDESILTEDSRSRPETMLGLLSHLRDAHHGERAYLLAAGLAPGDLDRVRERLRA
jgi:protein-tyrosine phosphatase